MGMIDEWSQISGNCLRCRYANKLEDYSELKDCVGMKNSAVPSIQIPERKVLKCILNFRICEQRFIPWNLIHTIAASYDLLPRDSSV